MRLVIQRVHNATITIENSIKRKISNGIVVLIGIKPEDDEKICEYICQKMLNLRIFDDEDGNMNLSLLDIGGDCLMVSNFTLYANCKKGRRPSFIDAAAPAKAQLIYDIIVEKAKMLVPNLQTGEFGAHMDIDINCNGPVTIILDSDNFI